MSCLTKLTGVRFIKDEKHIYIYAIFEFKNKFVAVKVDDSYKFSEMFNYFNAGMKTTIQLSYTDYKRYIHLDTEIKISNIGSLLTNLYNFDEHIKKEAYNILCMLINANHLNLFELQDFKGGNDDKHTIITHIDKIWFPEKYQKRIRKIPMFPEEYKIISCKVQNDISKNEIVFYNDALDKFSFSGYEISIDKDKKINSFPNIPFKWDKENTIIEITEQFENTYFHVCCTLNNILIMQQLLYRLEKPFNMTFKNIKMFKHLLF